MKKTVDVMVCDVCGEEEDLKGVRFIISCHLCGKDLCSRCMVSFNWAEHGALGIYDIYSFRFCPSHVKDIIKKCKVVK